MTWIMSPVVLGRALSGDFSRPSRVLGLSHLALLKGNSPSRVVHACRAAAGGTPVYPPARRPLTHSSAASRSWARGVDRLSSPGRTTTGSTRTRRAQLAARAIEPADTSAALRTGRRKRRRGAPSSAAPRGSVHPAVVRNDSLSQNAAEVGSEALSDVPRSLGGRPTPAAACSRSPSCRDPSFAEPPSGG